jgi:hypothetical protein
MARDRRLRRRARRGDAHAAPTVAARATAANREQDKAYGTYRLVEVLRAGSAIDAGTTPHDGYAQSLHARPRIEPAFGWLKTVAWMRKVKLQGLAKVEWLFWFASAAFNLRWLVTLQAVSA